MTVPILEGLDGVQKMSKSLNNYIGVSDPPQEMFGKVMSISDALMWRYYDLVSFKPLADIERLKKSVEQGANPRDIKVELGAEIADRFHGAGAGEKAKAAFRAQFSGGALPENIPEVKLPAPREGLPLPRVLKETGLCASTSDAGRQIQQRAVRVDQERVEDRTLLLKPGHTYLLQVGPRRFARVTVTLVA
jgi:tyrosyl-tRNA synthetase